MLVDAISLVCLFTVHPPCRIGLVRFVLLIPVPIALKGARVANMILYTYHLTVLAKGPDPVVELGDS